MDDIQVIANKNNLFVVEDCAQAHGARYKGRSVGCIGDIAAWSFCQDKIMTTAGEGGMVTTNSENLFNKVWSFKDHGKSYDAVFNRQHPVGFRWLHESIGSNCRLTEIQSAIGLYQLEKLKDWTNRRNVIANRYREVLSEFDFIRVPPCPDSIEHAYYRFYAFWQHPSIPRNEFIKQCKESGLLVDQGSCSEVYLEKAFDNTPYRPKERLPVAKELGETSLMFLVHPTLTEAEIQKTCDVLSEVMQQASK